MARRPRWCGAASSAATRSGSGADAGTRLAPRRPHDLMADPVSWLLIAEGWEVVDRNGRDIGRVEAVLADEEKDIFDGLAVATKLLGRPRYVPAERVTTIVERRVGTDLAADETASLRVYNPER